MINSRPSYPYDAEIRVVPYYLGHFLIYLGFVTISLVIIWLGIRGYRIYSAYQMITQHLAALENFTSESRVNPAESGFAQMEKRVQGIATGFELLEKELTPFLPLTPYLGWVPVYGGDLQATPILLVAGQELSQAGLNLFERLSPPLEAENQVAQPDTLPAVVGNIAQAKAEFEQVEILLRQHQAALNQLDIDNLSPGTAQRINQFNEFVPLAIAGLEVLRELPLFLGAESPRTYLILTQNSDELRPTGGYINAAGHITFQHGQIVDFVMQDSYEVDDISADYPYPPYPIYQYMAADYWVLRDASWSPDFPTTARAAMKLYEMGQKVKVNGVIAFDQQALPFILKGIEPLGVDGEQVTSNNVIEIMRQRWAPEPGQDLTGAWWLQRKSFMLALAETMQQKFTHNFGAVNVSALISAARQALAEKHILLYMEDPVWARLLTNNNWDGALAPVKGDYLMVVDANLGFNKASALVERQLTYQVALAEDGSAQAQVKLVYQHPAQRPDNCSPEPRYEPVYEQNMERCYWNYLRLLAPAKAQLLNGPKVIVDGQNLLRGESTSGDIDITPEDIDKVSWGQLFLLAPQETITLDYAYQLPPNTAHFVDDHWEYNLFLQKQPGALEPEAQIIVTLPKTARLRASQPQPNKQKGFEITYQVTMDTDQQIKVTYILP